MTTEELQERYERAHDALADALNQLDEGSALCDVMEHELQLEHHQDAHALIQNIFAHCLATGQNHPMSVVSLAFNLGRKFGSFEAADAWDDFTNGAETS